MTAIALPVRLTIADAKATLERLVPALAAAGDAVIDASPLKEMDTSAVAVLLDCQRQAQAAGRPLRIVGAPAKLVDLAKLYGVDSLLAI